MKGKIAVMSIDALFKYGLPAMANIVGRLNDKDVVTNEDIDKIGQEMKDSAEYFE